MFMAVFALGVRPSWWLMERLWTTDFSSSRGEEAHSFAVIVRNASAGGRYAVAVYPDITEDSTLVTDFDDHTVAAINRDLRASISAENSNYVYFKVLRREGEYTDVQLETPTTGDFWSKYSYRLSRGKIRLLRGMRFGPIFGLTVAVLPVLAGVLTIRCFRRLFRLHHQPSG